MAVTRPTSEGRKTFSLLLNAARERVLAKSRQNPEMFPAWVTSWDAFGDWLKELSGFDVSGDALQRLSSQTGFAQDGPSNIFYALEVSMCVFWLDEHGRADETRKALVAGEMIEVFYGRRDCSGRPTNQGLSD